MYEFATLFDILIMMLQTKPRVRTIEPPVSDDEEVPDSQEEELEYNEESPEESEDSGSEFELDDDEASVQGSEDEDDITTETKLRSFATALEEVGIDADELVMNVVVQESIEMARESRTSGASSSKARAARSVAAALRAAAAEQRITRSQGTAPEVIDVDADELEYNSDVELVESSQDDAPEDEISPDDKGKGKAKARGKGKGKQTPKSRQSRTMTIAEMKREERLAKKTRKAEEKALRKKFGRKLTQVCTLT